MRTHKGIVANVLKALGSGNVICHEPTKENQIGQSSVATFVDDILDVIEKNPEDAFRNLCKFIHGQNNFS